MDGLRLTFHLSGINNQNFLMRDEQTGTYWQQISGLAVSGPMAGRHLTLVNSDELNFSTWKAEEPQGTILNDLPKFSSEYAPKNWDVRMKKQKVVIDFPEHGLKPRDLMLGIQAFGASRAFPYERVVQEKLVIDRVGTEPVLLLMAKDNESVRAFRNRVRGMEGAIDFYRIADGAGDTLMMDAQTGSQWNFQGCTVAGKLKGYCLERIPMLKDYWFDWRNYNPQTTVYGVK